MYLTYTEYQDMGGKLDEATFIDLERQARQIVDDKTFKRLKGETTYPDEVKECIYLLVGYLRQQELQVGMGNTVTDGDLKLKSQSNDGVSISYNTVDANNAYETIKKKINDTVYACLFKVTNSKGQFLTYRGIYPNE